MISERIYCVWDFWDVPREGIANFQGRPHVYKCQFSEAEDEWTDLFWLMEIDPDLLALDQERMVIFSRWNLEFEAGKAALESHPALPQDRARLAELQQAIGTRLQLVPERAATKRAYFVKHQGSGALEVQWSAP